MNKMIICVGFALSVCTCVVADVLSVDVPGGRVVRPPQGAVCVWDLQTRIAHDKIAKNADDFIRYFDVSSRYVNQPANFSVPQASTLKASVNAQLIVFLVDDPSLPMVLAAPEAGWAVANVSAVANDNPDPQKLSARVCKVLRRALVLAMGGSFAPDGKLISAPVRCVADLDAISAEGVVVEHLFGITANLKAYGIVGERTASYYDACEQGWAPTPTNETQKAIWDGVHTPPKNPMKIEFDPKKGQ